jgi:type VI secretion system protein ImpH
MAREKREQDTPLKERLLEEFYRFSFFQAVHLLELLAPEKTPVGNALSPGDEAVRFRVRPGFAFPPSDISGLVETEGKGLAEMDVTFMGLIGPNGVLPDWYNELAAERVRQKDLTLTSFLDMFHHRFISLFYLAWKKYRLTITHQSNGEDRISRALLCLIGLGTEGLPGRIGLPQGSFIFNSGLLSRQVPSAVALESAVAHFSGVEAEVRQFVDRIIPLDPEDYTRLGGANGELGVNAVCGSEVWENQTKFRLELGPMDYGSFVRLLPTGDMFKPIMSLVRYMVGIEFDFDLRLQLRREEVFPCRLGGMESPLSPRLGWTTWFTVPGETFPEDPCVMVQAPWA